MPVPPNPQRISGAAPQWAAALAVLLLAGCPQQVPDLQNFSAPDAAAADVPSADISADDTAQTETAQTDTTVTDTTVTDTTAADTTPPDTTVAETTTPDTTVTETTTTDTTTTDTSPTETTPTDTTKPDTAKPDGTTAECAKDSDCKGVSAPCQAWQCSAGTCYPLLKNSGPCEDGNPCTSGDVCLAGACQSGSATDCDDGNSCTTDTCASPSGCAHTNFADGVGCGGGKTCTAGVCGGGLSGGVSGLGAGDYETCAIVPGSGKLLCWGDDAFGQVGSGATSGKWYYTPQTVAGLSGVTQVDCNSGHCCAVAAAGLFCWGNNEFGAVTAVGAPAVGTAKPVAAPLKVLQPAVQVATGENHTCARDGGGTVRCWGMGNYGQLGDGNHTVGAAAVVTKVGASVKTLDCGKNFCCAVLEDGAVKCWGLNTEGQIGTGITGTTAEATVPTATKGVTGATAIASGDDHTCALVTGGKVMCWGYNSSYQTGNTGSSTQATPTLVPSFSGATAIAAGGRHTCALANGALYCWGSNGKMESAPGNTAIYVAVPSPVAGLTDPVSAALGYNHVCVRTATGALYCWGGNVLGQIGNGNSKDVKAPLLIQ